MAQSPPIYLCIYTKRGLIFHSFIIKLIQETHTSRFINIILVKDEYFDLSYIIADI